MKSKRNKESSKPEVPKKKKIFLKLFLVLIILGSFGHTYYNVFGAGLPNASVGITGQAISDVTRGFENLSMTSRIIIAVEWLAVLSILLYMLIKGRMNLEKDLKSEVGIKINPQKLKNSHPYETDLDILHELLEEKKVLRLSVIAKTFNVDIKTTMEWADILEDGNIATLSYPMVGSPKLTIDTYLKEKEAKKKAKERKKKEAKKNK